MKLEKVCAKCGKPFRAFMHHPNTADACKNACDCVADKEWCLDLLSDQPESLEECPNCLAAAYLDREHFIVCLHCEFVFLKWLPATLGEQLELHKEGE